VRNQEEHLERAGVGHGGAASSPVLLMQGLSEEFCGKYPQDKISLPSRQGRKGKSKALKWQGGQCVTAHWTKAGRG
jgi:hypothetical protein